MHAEFPDPKLTAAETALRSLLPVPARIDRDRLMFEAGRRASYRGAWPIATGAFAALSALLALRLAFAPAPVEPAPVMATNSIPASAPAREPEPRLRREMASPGFLTLLLTGAPDSIPAEPARQRDIELWLRGGPFETPPALPGGPLPRFEWDGPVDSLLLRRGRL